MSDADRWAAIEDAARLILDDRAVSRVLTYKGRDELRGVIAYAAAAWHRATTPANWPDGPPPPSK